MLWVERAWGWLVFPVRWSKSLILKAIGYVKKQGPWRDLVRDMWGRMVRPLSQPSYVGLVFASFLFGAVGIWIAGIKAVLAGCSTVETCVNNGTVFQSVISFFVAFGCLACMQLIVVEDRLKHLRAVSVVGLLVTVSLAIVAAVAYELKYEQAHWFLWLGLAVAFLQHWSVNFDEHKYVEGTPEDPLGGSPSNPVGGDDAGYET